MSVHPRIHPRIHACSHPAGVPSACSALALCMSGDTAQLTIAAGAWQWRSWLASPKKLFLFKHYRAQTVYKMPFGHSGFLRQNKLVASWDRNPDPPSSVYGLAQPGSPALVEILKICNRRGNFFLQRTQLPPRTRRKVASPRGSRLGQALRQRHRPSPTRPGADGSCRSLGRGPAARAPREVPFSATLREFIQGPGSLRCSRRTAACCLPPLPPRLPPAPIQQPEGRRRTSRALTVAAASTGHPRAAGGSC